jgi:hypothetical protein
MTDYNLRRPKFCVTFYNKVQLTSTKATENSERVLTLESHCQKYDVTNYSTFIEGIYC